MTDTTCNGWANYETWNVALWIGNDEELYREAKQCRTYEHFVASMREYGEVCGGTTTIDRETPDGVAWNDSGLDTEALDEMIEKL